MLRRLWTDLFGYQVRKDYTLKAGDIWGGVSFWGSECIEESTANQKRTYEVVINRGDASNYRVVRRGSFAFIPNSMVGEIPVYVAYMRSMPALDGCVNTDLYFAGFVINGYSCGISTDGYTQQEFVDLLLSVINHYGAYPSQNPE